MKNIFVVEFGGTPSRTELCLLMNCAAGLYPHMNFTIYPLDKDIKSPNYTNSRDFCQQYNSLSELSSNGGFASSGVMRRESLFDEVLNSAGISSNQETILNLVSDNGSLGQKGQLLLDICFDRSEQSQELQGGYYGRADIGAVTSRFLIQKKAYDTMELVNDIEGSLHRGGEGLDIVILCSSFGGTGASLGVNFGEYLAKKYKTERKRLRLHCIHIQPYFSFPDPKDEDPWKIDSHEFYAKSASVITAYGQKKHFIRNITQNQINNPMNHASVQDYVFDSFYYLGQEVLDFVSETNNARDDQRNDLHIIDMLVGMAIEDAVNRELEAGTQLFSYFYSNKGTESLTWKNMKNSTLFKQKHISFARFSAFILQVLEPLFCLDREAYASEALILHMYGPERLFGHQAKIIQETDEELKTYMSTVCNFCRNYLAYWNQIESKTTYGQQGFGITRFFCQDEIERILKPAIKLETGRSWLQFDKLTIAGDSQSYGNNKNASQVYNKLCTSLALKMAAGGGKRGVEAASVLLKETYKQCELHING